LKRDAFIRLCRARDRLSETHHDRELSIRAVAEEARMSPFHFIRVFAAVFGATPHQFRIDARLARAKYLLLGDHACVTDVCMEVGFSSLGSFSSLFSRRVGVAPALYRRHARASIRVPGTLPELLFPGCFSLMGPAFAILEKRAAPPLADLATTTAPFSQPDGTTVLCESSSRASSLTTKTRL
jgi:AraC-like DNA-binding protein